MKKEDACGKPVQRKQGLGVLIHIQMSSHAYKMYHYILLVLFFWSVFNYHHPSPRRERRGVGSCEPNRTSRRLGGLPKQFQQVTFCAQAAYLKAICSELDDLFCQKLIRCPQTTQETFMASQGVPERSTGYPKGPERSPKSAHGS